MNGPDMTQSVFSSLQLLFLTYTELNGSRLLLYNNKINLLLLDTRSILNFNWFGQGKNKGKPLSVPLDFCENEERKKRKENSTEAFSFEL